MKIMTLLVALMFVMSLMPLAIAEEVQENTDAFDVCMNLMENDFPKLDEDALKEKCEQVKTTSPRDLVQQRVKEDDAPVREVARIASINEAQKRLKLQLEKISEDKKEILDSLTEEQKEKFSSLDRARIAEYAEKDVNDMRKALDNLKVTQVKKEEAFQKRVVAKEKLDDARERYERSKERYEGAKVDYEQSKNAWKKAVKAKDDDEAIKQGKLYLEGAAEMVIASLEKVKSQIESNDDLTEEEAEKALVEIEEKIAEMEQAREQVKNAETKEEVKEASKVIQTAWERTRVRLAIHAETQVQTSVGEILSRSTALEQHLERILLEMEDDSLEASVEIDEKVEEFSEKIAEARGKFEESENLFEEAKETNNKEVLDVSKELSRDAHENLKEAQKILIEIVREVKSNGYDIEDKTEYVELIEENSSEINISEEEGNEE